MALDGSRVERILLYPEKSPLISAFWRDKYEKDASAYWNVFYKRNGNRFFKDRHYLHKEWGRYFQGLGFEGQSVGGTEVGVPGAGQVVLEVGCGTGNTVYPLLSKYPQSYVYACDFASRAVDLIKDHEDYDATRVKAFACDVTKDPLSHSIPAGSVDLITLVFVLSAIAPEKMQAVVSNLKSVLKPGGCILLRDYAVGDLAQERLMIKDQQISENFYVRGDGTRVYYFSEDDLGTLFDKEGFECKEMKVHCRQLENRSRKIVMDRRWIQGVFYLPRDEINILSTSPNAQSSLASSCCNAVTSKNLDLEGSKEIISEDERLRSNTGKETTVDLSDGCAAELFGGSPALEPLELAIGNFCVRANCLPKEHQHTVATTGLMLWESATAFAELLALNPAVTAGKTVLELGCGSIGLCSLITSSAAEKVVATDGDAGTIGLLQENLQLNKECISVNRISCHILQWGKAEDIDSVKAAGGLSGFQLIIGTDVTYVQEAVPLLFETARALLTEPKAGEQEPLLILCHRIRRVMESDVVSAAKLYGFSVSGLWTSDIRVRTTSAELENAKQAYVELLFKHGLEEIGLKYNSLQIFVLTKGPNNL